MCAEKIIEKLKQRIIDLKNSRIGIVLHENPDPDAIGAALGITKLFKHWNNEIVCELIYSGEISHAQNRTMVNVLNVSLTNIADIKDAPEHLVSVDCTPERAWKDAPEGCKFLLTIDHHRSETKNSEIVDIRPVGSTCAIVWDYIRTEGIEFQTNNEDDADIATAMVVGIKTDTSDFVSENVSDLDYEAYQALMSHVDRRHLSVIIQYPIPAYYFDLRSSLDKEDNTKIEGSVFVGGVGYISGTKRDALPSMAEERARVEGIETAFVFAIVGDHIEVSVRSIGLAVDVNALCQKIFGKQYAGGKMGAGAAKIPMGFLALGPATEEETETKMWEAVKQLMIDKIFHVMRGN